MTRSAWSAEGLRTWLETIYRGESIVVLANREPFRHDHAPEGGIAARRSAGGLVTALEPIIEACFGVWVAHGAGTADRLLVDGRDGLDVPPANPLYRLRRVWLDAREERGYYYGFANEGLWPLCHRAHVQPVFRLDDFKMYQRVNMRFADAVCEEAGGDAPVVFVQDYHFALAPHLIRQRLPYGTIAAFWHIPWPHPQDFAICPWGRQLLVGLLGSTLIGFQTPDDCRNFVDTVEHALGAHVNRARTVVTYADRATAVRAYPVSVEWPSRWASQSPSIDRCRADLVRELGLPSDACIGVGVDRLDYTKGIVEKFLAVEQLLDSHVELRQRFTFVQIAEPSRTCLPAYAALRSRLVATANRINDRFGSGQYRPIVLLEARHEPAEVFRVLRSADVCYVGSLHDGMNLVAKEFVSARDDNRGVLILSRFTGAARELTEALIVNPYAIDECAEALAYAVHMPREEQARRMRAMRAGVSQNNTYRWGSEILSDLARLRADQTRDEDVAPSPQVNQLAEAMRTGRWAAPARIDRTVHS